MLKFAFSDLTLLEYNLVKFCPSLVTTAVVLQANYVTRGAGWSDSLEHYSGYSYEAGKFFTLFSKFLCFVSDKYRNLKSNPC